MPFAQRPYRNLSLKVGAGAASEITDNLKLMQTPIPPELRRELRDNGLVHRKTALPA
jgi:hypothetical protein